MTSNIWRILRESDINSIKKKNPNKLVVIAFIQNDIRIKHIFGKILAPQFNTCLFGIIYDDNKKKFTFDTNEYISIFKKDYLPVVLFFYDNVCVEAQHSTNEKNIHLFIQKFIDTNSKNRENDELIHRANQYTVKEMTKKKALHNLAEIEKVN